HGGLGALFQRETGLDPANPATVQAQANWVAKYIKEHRGSLSQWRGLMHGIERIHRGQTHPFDNAFSLPSHSSHAGLHGEALRHMFGHPHRNSAAPPPKKHDEKKEWVVNLDGHPVGKMVERRIVASYNFSHRSADFDARS